MTEKGYKGGLVSRVRNKHTGRKYIISTARERGQDYWATVVFPSLFFGLLPNFSKKILAIVRNRKEEAHEVHSDIKEMILNAPENEWFEQMPNPKPSEGWSPDAEKKLTKMSPPNVKELRRLVGIGALRFNKKPVDHLVDLHDSLSKKEKEQIEKKYFSKDLSTRPREYLAQLALRFWKEGKGKEALSCYTAALVSNPKDSILLLNRGNLFFEMGRYKEALADYEALKKAQTPLPDHLLVNYQIIQKFGIGSPILKKLAERNKSKFK